MTEKNLAEQVAKHSDDLVTTRFALATLVNMLPAEQRAAFVEAFRSGINAMDDLTLFLPIPEQTRSRLANSATAFEALLRESDTATDALG